MMFKNDLNITLKNKKGSVDAENTKGYNENRRRRDGLLSNLIVDLNLKYDKVFSVISGVKSICRYYRRVVQ